MNVTDLPARFVAKIEVDPVTGCWVWQACRSASGYGKVGTTHGNPQPAHRITYQLLVGPIPDGLQIDHLCRNRPCVNPSHLEPVTCRENLRRGMGPTGQRARQTHCIHGHEFTTDNTYIAKNGTRHCRKCSRQKWRMYRERRKAAQP